MIDLQITKYNPALRQEEGFHLVDEWTDFSDIGKKLGGKKFTLKEYLEMENKYIQSAILLMKAVGVDSLVVQNLEPRFNIFNVMKRKLPKYVFKGMHEIKYSLKEGMNISGSTII